MELLTSSFIAKLVGHEDIPTSSLMIAQMGVGEGGLGLTAPGYRTRLCPLNGFYSTGDGKGYQAQRQPGTRHLPLVDIRPIPSQK